MANYLNMFRKPDCMDALTILLFFAYTYGIGFAISKIAKNSDNFLERNLMRIGIGLAALPLLGVILNLLHIPLDCRIFLILSLIIPVYFIFKNYGGIKLKIKLRRSDIYLLIVLI